jgi:hypothetical protein
MSQTIRVPCMSGNLHTSYYIVNGKPPEDCKSRASDAAPPSLKLSNQRQQQDRRLRQVCRAAHDVQAAHHTASCGTGLHVGSWSAHLRTRHATADIKNRQTQHRGTAFHFRHRSSHPTHIQRKEGHKSLSVNQALSAPRSTARWLGCDMRSLNV